MSSLSFTIFRQIIALFCAAYFAFRNKIEPPLTNALSCGVLHLPLRSELNINGSHSGSLLSASIEFCTAQALTSSYRKTCQYAAPESCCYNCDPSVTGSLVIYVLKSIDITFSLVFSGLLSDVFVQRAVLTKWDVWLLQRHQTGHYSFHYESGEWLRCSSCIVINLSSCSINTKQAKYVHG